MALVAVDVGNVEAIGPQPKQHVHGDSEVNNSLPTPKINSLPTQKALFGVQGESIFRFPIGTEASLLETHHKQTLQGK